MMKIRIRTPLACLYSLGKLQLTHSKIQVDPLPPPNISSPLGIWFRNDLFEPEVEIDSVEMLLSVLRSGVQEIELRMGEFYAEICPGSTAEEALAEVAELYREKLGYSCYLNYSGSRRWIGKLLEMECVVDDNNK